MLRENVTFLIALPLIVIVLGAPLSNSSSSKETLEENCQDSGEFEVVDERQNGTENYRVNVNGVVLIYAPAKSILTAAGLLDGANLDTEFEEVDFLQLGQESTAEPNEVKPQKTKRYVVLNFCLCSSMPRIYATKI